MDDKCAKCPKLLECPIAAMRALEAILIMESLRDVIGEAEVEIHSVDTHGNSVVKKKTEFIYGQLTHS